MIEVSLLGPPRVERDGALVSFDTRKAMALLAHLAVTERPRPRDSLADLLWPASDPERARGALRRTLSSLRSAVGSELLEATRDHVCLLRGPGLEIDVDLFRSSLQSTQLDKAVALFRGDFLEGFAVRDAPDFEDWAQIEADNLRRELVAALAELTTTLASAGDRTGALGAARRWVTVDPLHEPAHRALIRLYAESGDRAAALVQYRECVRTLSRELGVPPLTETTKLYEAINGGAYAPPPAPREAQGPAPGGNTMPGFVGRSRELAALRSTYDSLGPDGGVALVEGEAGIGKTRLAEEFLGTLQADGARVLVGRAFEEETGLAYAPVEEALRARLREDHAWLSGVDERALSEAARLMPDLVTGRKLPLPTPANGPGAETRFLSGLWDTVVSALEGPRPGVLFLDDAQWADDATLTLLSYGLRRLTGRPFFLLMTGRTPYDHALRRAAAAVTLAGRGNVVHLERLPETAVAEMVRAVRPEGVGTEVVHRLWEESEGLPLFLVEYLRNLDEGGAWAMPEGAREVLRGRLGPLTETARQTLSAAAVIGRAFDTDAVRLVSGRTEDETVASLEELVGRGLLREGNFDYDFVHGLVRTLVYEQTSLARRRLLHGRAAALTVTPPASTARHLLLAGRERDAAEAFRTAGVLARKVFANADALAHLRSALALGHPEAARLQVEVGDLLTLTGEYAAAQASFEAAAAISGQNSVAEIEHRLGRLHHRRGDYILAQAHLRAALDATPQTCPAERASVTADLSLAAHAAGDPARAARSLAAQAHVLAQAAQEPRALCQSYNLLGMLATADGDTDEALSVLERSRDLADRIGEPDLQIAALNNLALAHRARDEREDAVKLATAALDLCIATSADRHHEAALRNNLADLLHASGRSEESMAHLKRAVEIFAEIGVDEEPRPGIWKLVRW